MLTIQNLSYSFPNKNRLFNSINLTVNTHDKVALIGNNGVGKSTLLKIIAGELQPQIGQIVTDTKPYYIPQIFGQFNHWTVAEALQVDHKLDALQKILSGNTDEENFTLLNDDWTIEDRCMKALDLWNLNHLNFSQKLETLSGGQKTKVFLAGIFIHQPELILLDEPSNHLDVPGRRLLYDFIQTTQSALIIVSHDRRLLNLLHPICELTKNGMNVYGGNFDFYKEQKTIEDNALYQDIQTKEKALRKAKEKERKTIERQRKSDTRAKKNLGKAGLPKIVSNTWKNNAERSTAKITGIHEYKTDNLREELQDLRLAASGVEHMKFEFDNSDLHEGKNLFVAENINFGHEKGKFLWQNPLNIRIVSGERIAVNGKNGAGKTTLLKIILGKLKPAQGKVFISENRSVYIDQDYSLIDNKRQIYEQAQEFNRTALQEHEIKIRLDRFLFSQEDWNKSCNTLSGGERMRLMLCCLNIAHQSPDIILLDEPVNNLDIQNIEILTNAINEYEGTLIVISHDKDFLEEINIERIIEL